MQILPFNVQLSHHFFLTKNSKPVLNVYYEALCPDCTQFFTQQVCPIWKSLGNYFDLDVVPYGNARVRFSQKCLNFEILVRQTIHKLTYCRRRRPLPER